MGATSVTGKGPGDSHKRVAYLSSNYEALNLTQTTSNKQDLIPADSGGGGGDCCDFDTEWELVYSRAVEATDPNDPDPVPTGITFDPLYDWAFGIHLEPYSPSFVATFSPITTPVLKSVLDLYIYVDFVAMIWSPDGSTDYTFYFQSEFSLLRFGAFLPALGSVDLLDNNGNTISWDGAGAYGPANDFTTFFQDNGNNDAYFVIARRKLAN